MNNSAIRAARLLTVVLLLVAFVCPAACLPAVAAANPADRVDGVRPFQLGVPDGAMPDVTMKSGVLCTEDGRILWSRRESDRRAIGSITKVMTAVVTMESAGMNELVTISEESKHTEYSSSFLKEGNRITVEELLESMLVRSANDGAAALAEHVAGDEDRFVARMNTKAGELGLSRTHFANPHGLDEKGGYASAADLAVLARYAMRKPDFRRMVAEKTAVTVSGTRKEKIENTNVLLGNYAGLNGIKTGWTDDAGYCVIVSAKRGGVELYAVVLGTSGDLRRFKEARELLDWGFAHYREQRLVTAGSVLAESPVLDYLDVTVPAAVSEESTLAVFDLAGPISRTVKAAELQAPVSAGQHIGVVTFTQAGRVIDTVPLVAQHDVRKPNPLHRLGIGIARVWRRMTGKPLHAGRLTPARV